MKRFLFAGLALVCVIGLQVQPVRAQDNGWNTFWAWFTHGQDARLTAAGIGVGAGTGAAGYLMTKKIIGGWLVDSALPHDAWTDGLPTPARH